MSCIWKGMGNGIDWRRDYYWFYEEWDQINKRFMKKYYKTFPELLMETMHSYRVKRENFEIIEHARHMDDDDEMDADAVILL